MKTKSVLYLVPTILVAMCLPSAYGQTVSDSKNDEIVQMAEMKVVSSSLRESMITAMERKREKFEIVDSIVADDINKLPDFSVTDALSRISGIQIDRERGEGNGNVAIRGLNQTESLLNGREIFSAEGGSRTFNMSELPSEMLAGIDVYKSSAANIIEGGLGGTIDVRLRRPFDFKGLEAVASVRGIYGDLIDELKFQYSVMVSDRFKVGRGELGVLLNATYQERAWREDFKNPGTPTKLTVAGKNLLTPSGSYEGTTAGSRERSGVNAVVQYKPIPELEFYAEGSFSELNTKQDTYGTSFSIPAATVTVDPNSLVLFPGTTDVASITYTDGVTFSTYNTVRDTLEKHRMLAVGTKWRKDAFSIQADLSYTDAFSILKQEGINTGNNYGAIKNFTLDTRGKVAETKTETILSDPNMYKLTGLAYIRRPYDGDMKAATVDAEYRLPTNFFTSIQAGARYATRNANNQNGMANQTKSITGTYAQYPDMFKINPYPDYFTSGNSAKSASWGVVHGNQDLARGNIAKLRQDFGITDPLPTGASNGLLGRWDINEDTWTGYLMTKFKGKLGLPFDGALGGRLAHTEETINSAKQETSSSGAVTISPLTVSNDYNDFLPSINTRIFIRDDFFLRLSGSKTLTRPSFPNLAPSLTLTQMVDPSQNMGSAGNPDLKPIRAWNADISLEKYFGKSSNVYLAGFYKDVDGFISSKSAPETYDGILYSVTRPQNLGKGRVKGIEVGGQVFLDFLSGWVSGFGLQANYTYVDSSADNPDFTFRVPLNNLSENSYNIILMYEYKKFSARLAYNWRDKFYNGSARVLDLQTGIMTVYPQFVSDYGWLDASMSYSFNKHVRFSIDGTNLLNTIRTKYLGSEHVKNNAWVNDVQVVASVTIRL